MSKLICPRIGKQCAGVLSAVALCALLLAAPLRSRAAELDDFIKLAEQGAPTLALYFLDRDQPNVSKDVGGWMRWERARIAIYRQRKDWPSIAARLSHVPSGLPHSFVVWASTQLADAYTAAGDGRAALAVVRKLIWSAGHAADAADLSRWRRAVIEAYLAAGDVDDALTAMLRYQQDYGAGDKNWKRLRARVLLRAGRPDEVRSLLARDNSDNGRALYLLARLRDGSLSPQKVRRDAIKSAGRKGIKADAAFRFWIVAAQAAGRAHEPEAQISSLSHALAIDSRRRVGLFAADGAQLWRAYLSYGRALGNGMQLLLGRDSDWYDAAAKLAKKHPVQARALFAVLAIDGASRGGRRLAHERFADAIDKSDGGRLLLIALYVDSNRFAGIAQLPDTQRRELVDDALARSDIKLASRLISGLTTAPKGADALFWQMRRARILIMGGDVDAGIDALRRLLEQHRKLPRKQIDRLMQVLFDLQSVGRNQAAIELFRRLPLSDQDDQLKREVLYWTADSYKAMGQYQEAARLYLRSAGLVQPESMDQWAQTARYQAAEALAQAGLSGDARRIYNDLLDATKDPSRRAVLQSKLQQLWLVPERSAVPVTNSTTAGGSR